MLGILCGLQSEAKIADRVPEVLVGCSAARQDRARALVRYLVDQGVTRLISFGLAGALSPHLAAGDLLLGASVMSSAGAWEADDAWNHHFLDAQPGALTAPVWGADAVVKTVEEKEKIYRQTGCFAVDMESHIVAQAAFQARIPFNIVRAVSDTASMALPPAALVPLKEDGRVDLRAVFLSVKEKPAQIFELARLGRNTSLAMRTLRHAASVMAENGA